MADAKNMGDRGRTVVLEDRYAYYRRCQTVKKNGVQCSAPAVKGERICCKHRLQEEMRESWERQRAALRLPQQYEDTRSVLRALQRSVRRWLIAAWTRKWREG
jgi:hypothetical protein